MRSKHLPIELNFEISEVVDVFMAMKELPEKKRTQLETSIQKNLPLILNEAFMMHLLRHH